MISIFLNGFAQTRLNEPSIILHRRLNKSPRMADDSPNAPGLYDRLCNPVGVIADLMLCNFKIKLNDEGVTWGYPQNNSDEVYKSTQENQNNKGKK
jgi:hypothetical protein